MKKKTYLSVVENWNENQANWSGPLSKSVTLSFVQFDVNGNCGGGGADYDADVDVNCCPDSEVDDDETLDVDVDECVNMEGDDEVDAIGNEEIDE